VSAALALLLGTAAAIVVLGLTRRGAQALEHRGDGGAPMAVVRAHRLDATHRRIGSE
jgi:hypothetical protein